jgi:hypothetical protein
MRRTPLTVAAVVLLVASLAMPLAAQETLPVDPPVLGAAVPRGSGEAVPTDRTPPAGQRTVDGRLDDWAGAASGFAGATVYSAGELIYTDHLFDAYGADDGRDADRRAITGPLEEAVPETYRSEATLQANLPGQFGAPTPEPLRVLPHYGDLDYTGANDLVELRLANAGGELWVLARTAQMTEADQTALLLLLDTGRDTGAADVPFDSGLATERADTAVLLAGDRGWEADLGSGAITELPAGSVATNPEGFDNAIEARLPARLLGALARDGAVAAAVGPFDPAIQGFADTGLPANVANVAFRDAEPVREWFDHDQALALHDGSIDQFFQALEVGKLSSGATERWVPGPGYHERIFASTTPGLAQESGREGLFQHYGVYLPTAVTDTDPTELPLTYWLHWRGGTAHAGAALAPGIFRHQGEDRDGIVVSPRGRGTSTWYVGRGHADILEVFADVDETFTHDEDRVYVSGHSMGGWGSYLLPILYPDKFAASFPVAGPVTQGAWTGVDYDGCDGPPCYIEANGSRPRDQHTRRMLDNLRNVPLAMFYAGADELVPIAGATRQHERLLELGYTHRFYNFPAYEHYTHPIADEWADGVRYLDTFTRDENPRHVTYVRDMPFERSVEEVQSGGIDFSFDFDRAYWMSELTPAEEDGRAHFDGISLAKPREPTLTVPDAGGPTAPNQSGPFAFNGLRQIADPTGTAAPTSNGFEVTLAGAEAVRLDLPRMGISTDEPVTALVRTDSPLELRLTLSSGGTHVLRLDAGEHHLTLQP